MSTMIAELYDALKAAGAPEDKAQAAAKALADYDKRFDHVDTEFKVVKAELTIVKAELEIVKAGLTWLKWISGIILAVIVALAFKNIFSA